MIHELQTTIDTHPMAGTTITMGSILIGISLKIIEAGHINPLIMDFFQLGAWSTAIIVGAFTVRSYVKKDNRSNNNTPDIDA